MRKISWLVTTSLTTCQLSVHEMTDKGLGKRLAPRRIPTPVKIVFACENS
jgi:hypothetical protein